MLYLVLWQPSCGHEVSGKMKESRHSEDAEQTARTRASELPNLTSDSVNNKCP